jgi:zinc transport system substrate-binding protein
MKPCLIIVLLLCFSSALKAENKKPSVVVSITPLGLLAESIVGDKADVTVLLPKQGSPHHYALKASDRQRVLSADIILWIGKDLEAFLAKLLRQRSTGVITAMALSGIQWPKKEEGAHDHHNHAHHAAGHDPHIWLSAQNNIVMVDALVAELSRIDPKHAVYYQANAEAVKQDLLALDKHIVLQLKPWRTVPFIVAHPAYTHFVDRYQLTQLDYISMTPERRSGAKHLLQLRRLQGVKCVFVDYGKKSKEAEQLADELLVPLYTLDPLGAALGFKPTKGPFKAGQQATQVIARLANDFHACLSMAH